MPGEIHIRHPKITNQPKTNIAVNASAADTSITVADTNGFTSSKYVVIGGLGSSKSEISLVGTISTTTAMPIAAGVSFAHAVGEPVQQIPYNQIEISYSTDFATLWASGVYTTLADAAAAASWSTLSTVSIQVSQEETVVNDQNDGRSYRWRYKNSTDTKYSAYQSYLLPTGHEEKSIAAILRKVTTPMNQKISSGDTGQVTVEFVIDQINECLRSVHEEKRRWSHDASFEFVASEIDSGIRTYALATNFEQPQSLMNVSIADGYNLTYIDKDEFDELTYDWHVGATNGATTSADSTMTLYDSSNLDDSGSIVTYVNGTSSTSKVTVRYSANNRATNVLTLTDAATDITTTIPTGNTVWQGAEFGIPTKWTIVSTSGIPKVELYPIPNETLYQRNLVYDGFLKAQQIDTEDDYVRIENPNVVLNWVRAAIARKTNNTTLAAEYMQKYERELNNMRRVSTTRQRHFLRADTWKYNPRRYRSRSINTTSTS